jgi:transposase
LLRGRDVQELKELQRQGMSIQAISKLTGWDRKTIRKYMQAAGLAPEYGPRSAPPSKLDAFKPYLEKRLGPGCGTRECCCANCASVTTQAATRF